MEQKLVIWKPFHIPSRRFVLSLDLSWLVVIPLFLWAIVSLYVPVLGASMTAGETWAVALLILLLCGLSLAGHVWAHALVAGKPVDDQHPDVSIYLFGDAAQGWPAAASPGREAGAALAGPVLDLILAALAYLIWNAQIHPILNLSLLFACAFNLWLAVINLIPAYPFDGGRLVRAAGWGLLEQPEGFGRLLIGLGYLIAAGLVIWGIYLIAQHARFSWQTGGVTIGFGLLIFLGLIGQPLREWGSVVRIAEKPSFWPVRLILVALLFLVLSAVGASLVLTNDGLEAPGLALSVEPMVDVPASYDHPHSGTFILTSVLTQAPITAVEWLAGQITPAIKIVPPEIIVPKNTSVQEVARQGVQMLDQSETTAVVVALRQAGYAVETTGTGVVVVSIEPDSPSNGILQPGDVITGLNGKPVQTTNELVDQIKAQPQRAIVHLQVQRGGQTILVDAPLMAPAQPGGTPRLGITIDSAGYKAQLPFPVLIHSQKIVGGPSAGLMFTLTVYNALSPVDITGGRRIAGTGTIDLNGAVGPIGGVQQKVVAAELSGAQYFLSPADNYDDARAIAHSIRVVKVSTFAEALQFLRSLPAASP